jgi:hypothetical protein
MSHKLFMSIAASTILGCASSPHADPSAASNHTHRHHHGAEEHEHDHDAKDHDHHHGAEEHGHHHGGKEHDHHGGKEHDHHGGKEHDHHGGKEHDHHHGFVGALDGFHEVFAPIWHMQPGPERLKKACDELTRLTEKAAAVQSGPVPEPAKADETGWKTEAGALVTEVDGLKADCAVKERPGVEARLKTVHDGMHKLGARVEGKH